jgi:hypothetical protein
MAWQLAAAKAGKALVPKNSQDLLIKLGLAAGAYFLVVRPVLVKLNIVDSADDKRTDKDVKDHSVSVNSAFSPTYYKGISRATILTRESAEALAKTLYEAIGWLYDDETAVYGVFRQLKYKTQVSFLADVFYQKYKADLYQYLARNLNSTEIGIVNGIVSNLA